MARQNFNYEKRQKEMAKKRKQEAKQQRKLEKKAQGGEGASEQEPHGVETTDSLNDPI